MMEPFPLFPSRLLDQNFGMCITAKDLILPSNNICCPNYIRPWKWYIPNEANDCGSTIESENDKFKIILDVQHFRPSEIRVKVINREILIEAKHEERLDEHGMISRQFTRRYKLPIECDPDDVTSNLSSDGILMVMANKKFEIQLNKEIPVPIQLCDSFSKKIEMKSLEEDNIIQEAIFPVENIDKDNCNIEPEEIGIKTKLQQDVLKEDHCCLPKTEFLMQSTSTAVDKILESKTGTKENLNSEKSLEITMDNMDQCNRFPSTVSSLNESTNISFVNDESLKSTCASSMDKSIISSVASTIDESVQSSVKSTMNESIKSFVDTGETIKCSAGSTKDESIVASVKDSVNISAEETSFMDESVKLSVASTMNESIKSFKCTAGTKDESIESIVTSAKDSTNIFVEETSFKGESSVSSTINESFTDTGETFKSSAGFIKDEAIESIVASVKDSTNIFAEESSFMDELVKSSVTSTMNESIKSFMDTVDNITSSAGSSKDEFIESIVASVKDSTNIFAEESSFMDESVKSSVTSTMNESIKSFMDTVDNITSSAGSSKDEFIESIVASVKDSTNIFAEETSFMDESSYSSTMNKSFTDTGESFKCSAGSTKDESIATSVATVKDSTNVFAEEIISSFSSGSSATMKSEESSLLTSAITSTLKANESSKSFLSDTITAALKEASENQLFD